MVRSNEVIRFYSDRFHFSGRIQGGGGLGGGSSFGGAPKGGLGGVSVSKSLR